MFQNYIIYSINTPCAYTNQYLSLSLFVCGYLQKACTQLFFKFEESSLTTHDTRKNINLHFVLNVAHKQLKKTINEHIEVNELKERRSTCLVWNSQCVYDFI